MWRKNGDELKWAWPGKRLKMGRVYVSLDGSFRPKVSSAFSAINHGHADAVRLAIDWLQSEILPAAERQDLGLWLEGLQPGGGFYEEDLARMRAAKEKGQSLS